MWGLGPQKPLYVWGLGSQRGEGGGNGQHEGTWGEASVYGASNGIDVVMGGSPARRRSKLRVSSQPHTVPCRRVLTG